MISRYEVEGPHLLAAEVRHLRSLCQHLGSHVSSPGERRQLAVVGARQSALLAYMSVNLGACTAAEGFALEAVLLATSAGDTPLLAWIKGTQSFCAYYRGRYDDALNLARAGLQLAHDHGPRIRLLSNGVARAAGKLGDRATVDRAVDQALELVERTGGPTGMTSCIDFAPYGPVRTAANAATAYLAVGDHEKALRLTDLVSTAVSESDSDWSRSLVGLDEATAVASGRRADLDRAVVLGVEALAASAGKPILSVSRRADELAAELERRGPHRAGGEFADALRDWRRRGWAT